MRLNSITRQCSLFLRMFKLVHCAQKHVFTGIEALILIGKLLSGKGVASAVASAATGAIVDSSIKCSTLPACLASTAIGFGVGEAVGSAFETSNKKPRRVEYQRFGPVEIITNYY